MHEQMYAKLLMLKSCLHAHSSDSPANYWECLPCMLGTVPMPVCGKYVGMLHKWMAKCAALSLRAECHRGALKSSGASVTSTGILFNGRHLAKKVQTQMCSRRGKSTVVSHARMNDEICIFWYGFIRVFTDNKWQPLQKNSKQLNVRNATSTPCWFSFEDYRMPIRGKQQETFE